MDDKNMHATTTTEPPVVKDPAVGAKAKVDGLEDSATKLKESHETVQLRRTIYSAAALDSTFWPTATLTFVLQIVILILYMENDFTPFETATVEGTAWEQFKLVLGRFVSYFLIWTNAVADMQNGVNLVFCTFGTDRILGALQLIVVFTYPFAFVCAIHSSEDYKSALKSTAILAMFLKLDETLSSILDLGLLKREIGQLVHTIENPLPPGYRETIVNFFLMSYTIASFFYVWAITLDFYPAAVILWFGFSFFFFRAFYLDMNEAKSKLEMSSQRDIRMKSLDTSEKDKGSAGEVVENDDEANVDLGEDEPRRADL